MGNEQPHWDGSTERRNIEGWSQYEKLVLNHISESKSEIKDIKEDVNEIKVTLAEFKVELKQSISSSATRTSGIVSIAISVVSGIIMYFLTGKA